MTADERRPAPGIREREDQRQAQSDHGRQTADQKGDATPGSDRESRGAGDQREAAERERDHVEAGRLPGGGRQPSPSVVRERVQSAEELTARGCSERRAGGFRPDDALEVGDGPTGGG